MALQQLRKGVIIKKGVIVRKGKEVK